MKRLNEILEPWKENLDSKDFSTIIREARDILGLRQYRVAEHLGMRANKLKNYEIGHFRALPSDAHLRAFADFYELPYTLLFDKALEQVETQRERNRDRRLRDGSSAVPSMRRVEGT